MTSQDRPSTKELVELWRERAETYRAAAEANATITTTKPGLIIQAERAEKTAERLQSLEAENERLKSAASRQNEEVCQTLGKALGYPWFKDDQKNFPDATADHGVCVGDHVAETLAAEAATSIEKAEASLRQAAELLERLHLLFDFEEPIERENSLGFEEPASVNALFSDAYAFLSSIPPVQEKTK